MYASIPLEMDFVPSLAANSRCLTTNIQILVLTRTKVWIANLNFLLQPTIHIYKL
uniref:Uncharacterized protein n=1 Tax=Arundo donax TaxID=35708 RepID=A0A0A9B422_ARUDO